MSPPRIAFVVQRYGDEIVGGAESLTRQLAERAVSDLGWRVTVFTTCARDYQTWRNEYPPGPTRLRGVEVLRFPTRFPRIVPLFGIATRLLRRLPWGPLRPWIESLWLVLQGPYAPGLLAALRARRAEFTACVFVTYLYWPTVRGLERIPGPNLLISAAHDEFPLYLGQVQGAVRRAQRFLANAEPERDLLARVFGREPSEIPVVGVGFDDLDLPPLELPRKRHLLYLGRLSKGKWVPQLMAAFARWADRHPQSDLELVLAGKRDPSVPILPHPRIRYVGFVSDEERRALTASAVAVVNPSPNESLSLIVFEALAQLTPVLVNRQCEVLAHYAEHVDTVFAFSGDEEFGRTLDQLLAVDWAAPAGRARRERAREWGRERYSWAAVLRRLEAAVMASA